MLIDADINSFAEDHSSPPSGLLSQLERDTHLHVVNPNMLSGHIQGLFLQMISEMIQPKRILEIGTYTAYGTICLAKGLVDGGLIHTIESNIELKGMVMNYITRAGLTGRTIVHFGEARDIIPVLDENFDLVFIDASKEEYSEYYDLVFDKVRKGGFIIADNVLWGGKVVREGKDKETISLIEFSRKVTDDERVENLLLPVRDGLMLIRKK